MPGLNESMLIPGPSIGDAAKPRKTEKDCNGFKPDEIEIPTYEMCEEELIHELRKRSDKYTEDFIEEFGGLDTQTELRCTGSDETVYRTTAEDGDFCNCGFFRCPECRRDVKANMCTSCSVRSGNYTPTEFVLNGHRLELIKKGNFDAAEDKEEFLRPRIEFWKKRIAVYGDKTDQELEDVDRSDQHVIRQIITAYKMQAAPYEMEAGHVFG